MRISYRKRLLLRKILKLLGIVLAVAAVVVIGVLIYFERFVTYERGGSAALHAPETTIPASEETAHVPATAGSITLEIEQKPETEQTIGEMGGYYITTTMLRQPEKLLALLREMEQPCAVMIEVKSVFGNYYYSSSVSGAQTADVDIEAIDAMIDYLHRRGFYMIAVVPAFRDRTFALDNQSCGLPLSGGALWMDDLGCYWLDPANETVQSHLMQVARELYDLGFSEIAFSEFRFPDTDSIVYSADRAQALTDAAQALDDFFAGSKLTLSYVTDRDDFPAAACSGRLYISNVDGSKVERYAQLYGSAEKLKELIFLANSRDTRFEARTVLRPLLTE